MDRWLNILVGLASGHPSIRVPWKQIRADNSLFISDEYRPSRFTLRDPSDMNKSAVEAYLKLWRDRQDIESGLYAFRFQMCLKKGSLDEAEAALYNFEPIPTVDISQPNTIMFVAGGQEINSVQDIAAA